MKQKPVSTNPSFALCDFSSKFHLKSHPFQDVSQVPFYQILSLCPSHPIYLNLNAASSIDHPGQERREEALASNLSWGEYQMLQAERTILAKTHATENVLDKDNLVVSTLQNPQPVLRTYFTQAFLSELFHLDNIPLVDSSALDFGGHTENLPMLVASRKDYDTKSSPLILKPLNRPFCGEIPKK
ncbi:uncharacterized protein BDR25DRAFT_353933 [Lindgomyces ingoldianus]|uniref:Uncharacterized protein n=1 Tax=Lindgomyces ingoldianus TaxID=673940 RepID=A0ACB6QZG5_9PLEO|nr:uncharacterized protein BDR25DRAFT_353933 [Lindgomyces ingoldianus]KAF2472230.1 hypothetical protein BDR25DRAFT_353933 [Lindgomyces ingoldianus]